MRMTCHISRKYTVSPLCEYERVASVCIVSQKFYRSTSTYVVAQFYQFLSPVWCVVVGVFVVVVVFVVFVVVVLVVIVVFIFVRCCYCCHSH